MNKGVVIGVIAGVLLGAAGFYSGMQYQKSMRPNFGAAGGAAFAGRGGAGGARGFGGGAAFGTILSIGDGTMTVQLPTATSTGAESGTKIVLFSSSTQVSQTQSVGTSNLKTGQSVTVAGTANSDGSITAQSIQIRPAGGQFGARGQ